MNMRISGDKLLLITLHSKAQVAELVDAADSKSAIGNDVLVRFQSWAQNKRLSIIYSAFFFF
jgi:hypothetical protein